MFETIRIGLRPTRALAAALAAATLMAAPLVAQAQTSTGQQPAGWQTNLSLYGWFPSFGGQTSFPSDGGSSINVSTDTIIDNLKMVFMGSLDVHNGRWGVFNDLVYMDVGGDKSKTRDFGLVGGSLPASLTSDLGLDLKAWVWTVAGEYRVIASPTFTMDALAGVRMLDLEETLSFGLYGDIAGTGFTTRTGSRTTSQTNWDGIVGVKGRYLFGDKREWFVPYYIDVGTGDSDLTWQGAIGLGYQFSWGAVSGLYRHLDYNFKSGGKVQDLTASGPQIGVTFRF